MRAILLVSLFLIISSIVLGHDYHSQDNRRVFFISPLDGASVKSPVEIKFGAIGIDIVPAGVDIPNSGHHHLLINIDKLPDMKSPIPSDENHLHFGGGQTETILDLPKGTHTLQLLVGNNLHIPHEIPLISKKIEITIE